MSSSKPRMAQDERLRGIRALVVGGGAGIGRAVVTAFAAEGALVAAVDRDGARLADLEGASASAAADATDPEEIEAAVTLLVDELGGLDALVHTVGVHDAFLGELTDVTSAVLSDVASEVFAVNATSALLCLRAALPALRRSNRASVTLTVSESAFRPAGGGPVYGASKWATRGLVSHLAAALAPAVRVNGVAPGGTTGTRIRGPRALGSTPVGERSGRDEVIRSANPLGVLIEPADVAAAYVYLAAPGEARAVSAAIINVDGGGSS